MMTMARRLKSRMRSMWAMYVLNRSQYVFTVPCGRLYFSTNSDMMTSNDHGSQPARVM